MKWAKQLKPLPFMSQPKMDMRYLKLKLVRQRHLWSRMECMREYEGPAILSDELIDEALAKQAEKEKKPEKKKHAYRGR